MMVVIHLSDLWRCDGSDGDGDVIVGVVANVMTRVEVARVAVNSSSSHEGPYTNTINTSLTHCSTAA